MAGASNIIMSLTFGDSYDYTDSEVDKYMKFWDIWFEHNAFGSTVNFFPFLRNFPGDPLGYWYAMKAGRGIRDILQSLVQKCREKGDEESKDYVVAAFIKKMKEMEGSPENLGFTGISVLT